MTRVLVVEDDPNLQRLYVRNLEKEGAEVDAAAGLAEVDELLVNEVYDMILCDVQLTDGDSLGLMQRLHEEGVPVVAISSDGGYARVIQEIGVDRFFVKPVNAQTLADCLEDVLGGASA